MKNTYRSLAIILLSIVAATALCVSTWRFKPAQREGEPVAVEMNIEVAFNKF